MLEQIRGPADLQHLSQLQLRDLAAEVREFLIHKMLTGRSDEFESLRKKGGLSGYPSRAESEHDWVESSHASAALSYADGLAKAFELTGHRNRHVVAVVGDGALTGGMCWEALNNIAASRR